MTKTILTVFWDTVYVYEISTNVFLILVGEMALMSGLPAYLNVNGTELLMNWRPLYLTRTLRSMCSYELLGAVGDRTIRYVSPLHEHVITAASSQFASSDYA